MRPRYNRDKVKKVLTDNDMELYQGEGYGLKGTPEVPGGGGVSPSLWKRAKNNDDVHTQRIDKLFRRYNKLRRMGVAKHNIFLAPLQDHSIK